MAPHSHQHATSTDEQTPLLSDDGFQEEQRHDRHMSSRPSTLNRITNALLAPFRAIMRFFSFSKATRMWILVAVDVVFLAIELFVGYYVGSLALIADAFHMLNDVISLAVGLWAVKIAGRPAQGNYTYGWQRAEILGAFFNGVFLVALCVTICLEAIQRFFDLPSIDNPELIGWVGLAGLISNLFGLLLFFDHGHSHGDGEHDHEDGHGEEGHSHQHGHAHGTSAESAAEEGRAKASVLETSNKRSSRDGFANNASPARRRGPSVRDGRRNSTIEDTLGHPSSMRQEWTTGLNTTQLNNDAVQEAASDLEDSQATAVSSSEGTEASIYGRGRTSKSVHDEHHHRQPKKEGANSHGGIGHNHGDLGMRGIMLHVLGDCLGNIGVIATALFIRFTHYSWKFYADPVISIVITAIILKSAIPLCLAASRILLQATPQGVDINEIENDINDMLDPAREPGTKPRALAHHLHVWQLTDTKLVASVHVRVIGKNGTSRYMALAKAIHTCLHEYGIDSSTIQPEFDDRSESGEVGASDVSTTATEREQCLMECDADCAKDGSGACCKPSTVSRDGSPSHSDHGHGHGHNH